MTDDGGGTAVISHRGLEGVLTGEQEEMGSVGPGEGSC